jgi:hypothetical protein
MIRRWCCSVAVLSSTVMPSLALAQQTPPPPPPVAVEPEPAPPPSAPRHTGFYLRLGAGLGGFGDSMQVKGTGVYTGTATGGTGSLELGLGGAIKPGLIIGGAVYSETMVNPTISINGLTVATDYQVGTLGLIGPFIEWYLNPNKGFHLGGALCAARITLSDDKGVLQTNSILGGGAVFDIGYEWSIGDDWGIGVMGRFIGAGLSDGQTHHDVGGGSVLASLTFN